tara:strand:+ start:982 stop:1461 length:480 start_codon:yes stop_codon:yes gene_type:complete
MEAKSLIFKFILVITLISSNALGKTIYGKANIIDGDTVHINGNKIRLHAIDAPEINQKCSKNKISWNCGIDATKFLKKIIGNEKISCETNAKDRYNRFIGVCYKNEIDLNSEMVANGWAIAYRYYSLDYINQEEQAKKEKKGIWIGEFEEPYLFRKKNK